MDVDFCSSFLVFVLIALFSDFVNCGYILGPSQMTWSNAKAHCETRNDVLYMQTELNTWGELRTAVTFTNENFWIGLSRSETSNEFRWVDNTALANTDYWREGQPDNTTDNNCVYQSSLDGKWSTAPCDNVIDFVCQTGPPVTQPRPTPYPRPQAKRDNNAVMWEGLLKGFACAGGLILAVAVIMHLPCCRNWVNKKEKEVFKRQREMQIGEEPVLEPVSKIGPAY